uniref:Replication termination factor 2 n=1 Tax=Panagrellus redivivus TaxID=6233 RepID=A0A7E4VQH7_PANRE
MGADGGSIPKRCELVKQKKNPEKVDKAVKNAHKWRNCQLSGEKLKKPIVACKLGRLFNKEEIINAKIDKALGKNATTAHIKSLSDVKELKLTDSTTYDANAAEKGDVYIDYNDSPFVCPITGINMNGVYNFVVNWQCGCVFSEKAMAEIKGDLCHGCNGPLDKVNIIQLNPEGEVLKEYEERVAAEAAAKKAKKAAAKAENGETSTSSASTSKPSTSSKTSEKKKKTEKAPKRKAEYSIQDDPNVSKAVKSMFTSSEEAKNQPKAHWVTHNPLYF